ncbi:MAG: hypothetical protein M1826_000362, partial [Phylliscum demangeonii]
QPRPRQRPPRGQQPEPAEDADPARGHEQRLPARLGPDPLRLGQEPDADLVRAGAVADGPARPVPAHDPDRLRLPHPGRPAAAPHPGAGDGARRALDDDHGAVSVSDRSVSAGVWLSAGRGGRAQQRVDSDV